MKTATKSMKTKTPAQRRATEKYKQKLKDQREAYVRKHVTAALKVGRTYKPRGTLKAEIAAKMEKDLQSVKKKLDWGVLVLCFFNGLVWVLDLFASRWM